MQVNDNNNHLMEMKKKEERNEWGSAWYLINSIGIRASENKYYFVYKLVSVSIAI